MALMYFGSKISDNMVKTPEGYLICKNVPIGRTGYMDYLGEELGIDEKQGQIIKVYRSPEELFSKATLASFEGKSVTNDHPSRNLTVDTVDLFEKGHMENVRQDGDYLMADLFVKDARLIQEIEGGKREVSCGYDCLWVPIEGTEKYEQKNIVGNHVAVVQNGRAGSHVSIKDEDTTKKIQGGKKMAKEKVTRSLLTALGFKHYVADADPEDVAEALDALNEDDVKDDDIPEDDVKDDDGEGDDMNQKILDAISQLGDKINDVVKRVEALEEGEKGETDTAADDLDELEDEMSDEPEEIEDDDIEEDDVQDDDVDTDEVEDDDEAETIENHDEEPDDLQEKNAADSAKFLKLVQDMKPIIMAIEDEATRNAVAKQFAKSVRDSKAATITKKNGYGNILNATSKNKKGLMDEAAAKQTRMSQGTQLSADAWNKHNAFYKEGGK